MAASPSPHYALPLYSLSIGDAIVVYWDGDRKWYPAEVTEARGDHECEVLYRDGEREWIRLDEVKFVAKRGRLGSSRSKRAKTDTIEEEAEDEDSGGIEKIRDVLFDTEDRLPLEGVLSDDLDWWKAWHDEVTMAVVENNIRGLMDATLSLALQLKPCVRTTWWDKHSDSWKERLNGVATTRDAIVVVKDLQNNAISWSMARKLFSGKVQAVACRRSKRLKKKTTFEDKSRFKNSTGDCKHVEEHISPCLVEPSMLCSVEPEASLGSPHLSHKKSSCIENNERSMFKNHGASNVRDVPQSDMGKSYNY